MPSILSRAVHVLSKYLPTEAVALVERPFPGLFASGIRDDYSVDRSLRQLTPEKLARAMRAADEGDVAAQYEVFELVEQDAHVASVWAKRRRGVTSKTFKIIPAIDEVKSAEGKRAAQAAELCEELVLGRWGQGGIENWSDGLKDLTDAIGKGFALSQIVWELDAGRWVPRELRRWPQGQCVLGWHEEDLDRIKVLTDENMVDGEELTPHQWITHIQKEWSVPLGRAAMLRAVTWFYLFKRFAWKDWVMFLERYGSPMRVGKYHAAASDTEKAALWKAVKELGRDSACILPEQSVIELVETKTTGSGGALPHPSLVDYCNAEISKLVLGNTMTTEQGDRGARSLGEVYERGESEQTEDDCDRLACTLRRDLFRPLVGFNLGWGYPVPKASFFTNEEPNLEVEAGIDEILVTKIGLPLGKRYFYERYGRPMPEEGEEIVSAPLQKNLDISE